jgi:Kdo2-lipid IVA lauroyltransferase/acyltransferase
MTQPSYSFRSHAFGRERTYRIGTSAVHWTDGKIEGRIAYTDVDAVLLTMHSARGLAALNKRKTWLCHLRCHSGQRVTLSSLHCAGLGSWEDRSTPYIAFIDALMTQLRKANPSLQVATKQHWTLRLRNEIKRRAKSILARLLVRLSTWVRDRDPDRTAVAAGRLMRRIGPWLRHHRVARANLRAAFPEKSARDIDLMLRGIWDNFGQAMAEHLFIDRLCDGPPGILPKRTVADPIDLNRLFELRDAGQPALIFGAHLANCELPGVVGTVLGLELATLHRPLDFEGLARILELRTRGPGMLIPAGLGAAPRIWNALSQGSSFGMLVDQHFGGGVDVVFFGRQCKVNPTLAWFAHRLDCPIHGARAIRLPDRRFRLELTEALRPPRDQDGKVDVAGTMQMITTIIEGWVREYPEQWLWMHRRWR